MIYANIPHFYGGIITQCLHFYGGIIGMILHFYVGIITRTYLYQKITALLFSFSQSEARVASRLCVLSPLRDGRY